MEYLDFELRVGAGTTQIYPITVVRSPAGEASATVHLALDDPTFKESLQTIEQVRSSTMPTRQADDPARNLRLNKAPSQDERAAAEAIGRRLFDALLPAKVLTCYRRSRDLARTEGKHLRLRLRIEAPELAALPWEFLFDADEGDHISLNQETPLTRYLELDRAPASLTIPPPIRILGMVASPRDLAVLDVAQEKQRMAASIDHLVETGTVELTWLDGQTLPDLDRVLRESKQEWHIFHFIGHGGFDVQRGEGLLALADEDDNSHPFSARELGRLLARHPSLRLAVLNACEGARASEASLFTSTGAVLMQRGIPAVVSMQYPITDHAALEFTRNFYDAFARKLPVDAAVTEARYWLSLTLPHSAEWGAPVLYMRAPTGNLFDINVAGALFPQAGTTAPASATQADATPQHMPPAPLASTPAIASPLDQETQRGLAILRRRVQQFWIESVLEHSLFQKTLIDLGMTHDPTALENPWSSLVERPGATSQPLPPGRAIADVFDEADGLLLILGEPGSGKTTTLLGLARTLLARSQHAPVFPIPVVFNLSAWVEPQATVLAWLVNELSAKYQIPKKIGRTWLEANHLLPLLDGLDELRPERRAACIQAINVFRQEAGLMRTVVCCRLREYIDLPARLILNAAVRLQPLTDEQVHTYLVAAGDQLAALQTVLQQDSALRIEARSPLMLNLMARTYQDLTAPEVMQESSATSALWRQQLMEAYVARMFRRVAQRRAA